MNMSASKATCSAMFCGDAQSSVSLPVSLSVYQEMDMLVCLPRITSIVNLFGWASSRLFTQDYLLTHNTAGVLPFCHVSPDFAELSHV